MALFNLNNETTITYKSPCHYKCKICLRNPGLVEMKEVEKNLIVTNHLLRHLVWVFGMGIWYGYLDIGMGIWYWYLVWVFGYWYLVFGATVMITVFDKRPRNRTAYTVHRGSDQLGH